jgi:hypothetical protein
LKEAAWKQTGGSKIMAETEAFATLTLLESRLHHLEFLLSGSVDSDGIPEVTVKPARSDETVVSRLKALEDDLTRLTSNSRLVKDMLHLQAQFPDVFGPSDSNTKAKTMDAGTEASVVLAHASTFPETASRLSSLKDLTIPPAEASAKLLELQPRIDKVKEVQAHQLRQVAELRERTARIVEQWVSNGVVGSAEAWAEVESRVRDVEKDVRRIEHRKREENA